MQFIQFPVVRGHSAPRGAGHAISAQTMALLLVASACFSASACAETPAAISRTVVVQGSPAQVWAMIGSFCAIELWLPPVGTCSEDGAFPPTRTLVTRDGTATFIERQTARSDTETFYSYVFVSSPLPVSRYSATIRVKGIGKDESTVTWSGTYTPDAGKENEAAAALDGIYASGLESIQRLAVAQLAPLASPRVAP
jgi:Polyketide cyclase / dehydrase and lipid transport